MSHPQRSSNVVKREVVVFPGNGVNNPLRETQVLIKLRIENWLGLVNRTTGVTNVYGSSQVTEFPINDFYFSPLDEEATEDVEYPFYDIDALVFHDVFDSVFASRLKQSLEESSGEIFALAMEKKPERIDIVIDIMSARFQYETAFENNGVVIKPASKSSIEALEKMKLEKQEQLETLEKSESAAVCSVCYDDFEMGNDLLKMPCGHMFHNECLITWLKEKNTCPLCRFEMPIENSGSD